MSTEKRLSLRNGNWVWSELRDGLLFLPRDIKEFSQKMYSVGGASTSICSNSPNYKDAVFKDTFGSQSQTMFRKHYQRKVKLYEDDVVILQDIKDVAIFTCNLNILTLEFISYFHTKAMDVLLRSLIIYFQYYCQVWNKMQQRRIEASRKLRQPIVTVLEDVIRDDLADLRSMVARDYAMILMGKGDSQPFHHMSNKNNISMSDKDRKHFEMFILMAQRVVWIALGRKYMTLIEKELNRLLRTDTFNPIEHGFPKSAMYKATPEEMRILKGKACKHERKLLHRSPAIQEIILNDHDYRMLAIGVTDTGFNDERQIYLEAAYIAPEEMLEELGIGIGILGVPRKYLDTELKPKEISTTQRRVSIMKPIPEFVIPPRKGYGDSMITETLPKARCRYHESEASKTARKKQCKLWREYVTRVGQPPPVYADTLSCPSHVTLRTSIAPAYSKYG
ncbi:unnamed protein product [Phaedon cochleariae]|uniref:Uncharacterized protein n=1 Tax=Phaedon cochleariae TaxID=80249 RepID=A0A9N9SDX4_PHACE|nr:unnamed protein product [Phaedon cochleariae]